MIRKYLKNSTKIIVTQVIRKRTVVTLTIVHILFVLQVCAQKTEFPYQNPELPVEKRVDDLMRRMTLEEKIGQMCQYIGIQHIENSRKILKGKTDKNSDRLGFYPGLSIDELKRKIVEGEIGSFLHVKTVEEANMLQELALQSRLKIPLLLGIDAIHGHALFWGATVYPTQLSLSSTWDDSLLYEVAKETAQEVRVTGMHWTFSPNVEIARDPRWGRTGETFGEDPYLVSRLGVAFTQGYQGDLGKENILACAKHFVGGGESVNGTNAAPIDVSERELREIWFPSFEAQVNAGVYTFMAAHNEVLGVPAHASKFLLTDILRNEWDFKGFVVSDWMDIERLHDKHHVAETGKTAVEMAVNAGIDMHMHGPGFFEPLLQMVKNGTVSEKRIDKSVKRILTAKFMLGLFDDPLTSEKAANKVLFSEKHQTTALIAAREGIILLKNDNLLPLDKAGKILVTGPNANNQRILGDWALKQPSSHVITVFEGMKKIFKGVQVDFINSGESLRHPDNSLLKNPIEKSADYDAVVIVVGSNSLRYDVKEKNCGENIDRGNINLQGNQLTLVKEIYKRNKNVVVVFVNGRPLSEPWIKENIPAIIEAWEPGAFGGQAIAEILKGDVNPSGKLTVTIPFGVSQIHSYYNHKPTAYFHPYIDIPSKPLWYFGEGYSYTTFEYSNLTVKPAFIKSNDTAVVEVSVTNTGSRQGCEIVQLYINDNYSSVTRPVKELKDYKRLKLEPGQTQRVKFFITPEKLAFYDINMKKIVEPGDFTIMVGASSKNSSLLKKTLTVINNKK